MFLQKLFHKEKQEPIDISRFIRTHKENYDVAKYELTNGVKESHWIWYIFPQLEGLGHSQISKYYSIHDINEAKAYIQNPELKQHMIELCNILLLQNTSDPEKIFGYPDYLKVQSSLTLFSIVEPKELSFQLVLNKYYNGKKCEYTVKALNAK